MPVEGAAVDAQEGGAFKPPPNAAGAAMANIMVAALRGKQGKKAPKKDKDSWNESSSSVGRFSPVSLLWRIGSCVDIFPSLIVEVLITSGFHPLCAVIL